MDDRFHLLPYFPQLPAEGFTVTSPSDPLYNCIAWAANDTGTWWEPGEDGYWPEGVVREATLEAFVRAFATLRFSCCASGELEAGFEKVAIYADAHGPQHAARQLVDGTWTSKLGPHEDVAHRTVQAVESDLYGTAVQFLKRAI